MSLFHRHSYRFVERVEVLDDTGENFYYEIIAVCEICGKIKHFSETGWKAQEIVEKHHANERGDRD